MILNIPPNLPAVEDLKHENINVLTTTSTPNKKKIRLLIVNLMPVKQSTETDFIRLLYNSVLPIEIEWLAMKSHSSKNTSKEHIDKYYKTFEDIKKQYFDGLIITGAPIEHLAFEEVTYWKELTGIFDWGRSNVSSTLFVCWAAQAGLYYHYGVPKYPLPEKMFGVFEHSIKKANHPIFRGFDDIFYVPHSRHTEIRANDIECIEGLEILSSSVNSGIYLVEGIPGKEFFITGHSEYAPKTLDTEYKRDLGKGLAINAPQNYYRNDDPSDSVLVRWRAHANLLFNNWLNQFVVSSK